jgi:hypothetical protein
MKRALIVLILALVAALVLVAIRYRSTPPNGLDIAPDAGRAIEKAKQR